MFSFIFKSNNKIHNILELGLVDIHNHILPGIDDGAKNVDDSISLIHQATELGFKSFIATPHIINGVWNNTKQTIQDSKNLLENHLVDKIKLDFASEYMIDYDFYNSIKIEPLLCLKENYILVEFSFSSMPSFALDAIYELQIAGYIPVLAHPERYIYLKNNLDFYTKLKNNGCLLQLNLLSLSDYYGKEINKITQYLIDNKMYNFIGSDLHSQKHIDEYKVRIINKKNIPYVKDLLNNNENIFG